MRNATCRFFNLIVEVWKQCKFMHLVMFSLEPKLLFTIVTRNKDLTLGSDHNCALLATADRFDNDFIGLESSEHRRRWL